MIHLRDPRKIKGPLASAIEKASIGMDAGPLSFISNLMTRPSVPMKWKNIKGEYKFSILFADRLRKETIAGKLRCIWFHVPNEGPGRTAMMTMIMRAMGLIPGVTDYVFMGGMRNAVMELKFGTSETQDCQLDFRKWCKHENVPIITLRAHSEADIGAKIEKAMEFLAMLQIYRP